MNDLFDLRADSASGNVERASEEGLKCCHGGSEDEGPKSDSKCVPVSERTDLVEVAKSHRPESLRRCSETRTSPIVPVTDEFATKFAFFVSWLVSNTTVISRRRSRTSPTSPHEQKSELEGKLQYRA